MVAVLMGDKTADHGTEVPNVREHLPDGKPRIKDEDFRSGFQQVTIRL